MICRPEDENGDVLPVLSSSDLLRDTSAETVMVRNRLAFLVGDWWENPTWGNAIVEMLKESRLTEADGRAIAGYLSSYVRETAGVLDVRDVQYSMEEGRLRFSCVIESDKGSANVQYEI